MQHLNQIYHLHKIIVVGDIMNHEKQHQQLQACIDNNLSIAESAARFFSEDLISLLHSADTVIGNLETLADDSLKMSSFTSLHPRFISKIF
jgi:predicted glycosyltransferase